MDKTLEKGYYDSLYKAYMKYADEWEEEERKRLIGYKKKSKAASFRKGKRD